MIIDTTASSEKEQCVFPPPQFELGPPGESPFEALPATFVTNVEGGFNLNWVEEPMESDVSAIDAIRDDILKRSGEDVERFPHSAFVHANYAVALMNRGLVERAEQEFEAALRISPRHFMSMANLARLRTLRGDFNEAERLYKELADSYPKEPSVLVNLSYVLLRTNRFDEAIQTLYRAIRTDDEAIFPRYLIAVCLLMLGRTHEAIGHLRFAARSEVRSPAVHQTLGVAYLMSGDAKGAVRSFKTALTLAPEMRQAIHALANVLLQQDRTESLIDLLQTYLGGHQDDIAAREILAEAYWRSEDYSSARLHLRLMLSQLRRVQSNERQRARLLNNLGACYDRLGDSDRALERISRSILADPALDPTVYVNLGNIYLRRHDLAQVSRVIEQCNEVFPGNHLAPELQAMVLIERHCYDDAAHLLREELATGKATGNSYALLGWCLTDFAHDSEDAVTVLSDGLRRFPHSATVANNLAYAFLMTGEPQQAGAILTSFKNEKGRIQLEDRIALEATWGLLSFWQGDLATGQEYYKRAEEMAHGSRQTHLAAIVRQKMHLELAKALLRQDQASKARSEIARGLLVKNGREVYERDLIDLRNRLEGDPSKQ